jgi:hypothetical protein
MSKKEMESICNINSQNSLISGVALHGLTLQVIAERKLLKFKLKLEIRSLGILSLTKV